MQFIVTQRGYNNENVEVKLADSTKKKIFWTCYYTICAAGASALAWSIYDEKKRKNINPE